MEALVKDPKKSSPTKASPQAGIIDMYTYIVLHFVSQTPKPFLNAVPI